MPLSSTQIGAIGENLLINAVMKASDGRLSPFQPLADDDGLDVLFFHKDTGNSVAVQLKCRTVTLRKRGSKERGNVLHFQVRKATFNKARSAYLIAGLLNAEFTQFEVTWLVPMAELLTIGRNRSKTLVIRPSRAKGSKDRFLPYRFDTVSELAQRIIELCEAMTPPAGRRRPRPAKVRQRTIGRPQGRRLSL